MIDLNLGLLFHLIDTFRERVNQDARSQSLRRPIGRAWLLRSWCCPEAHQVFREVAHAGAPQALAPGDVAKGSNHPAPFLVISPQVTLQLHRRRMLIQRARGGFLNFMGPKLSFFRVRLKIVEDHLFTAIEAHARKLPKLL